MTDVMRPHVLLIAGPAGAGKTSMATLIGCKSGWVALSEDEFWGRLPRDPHLLRTAAEKAVIQAQVVVEARAHLAQGKRVVIEFIIYEDPPQPILFYADTLTHDGYTVAVRVLCPTIETLMQRQAQRGNDHDTVLSVEMRRGNAEHQLRCLHSQSIDPAWVVDASQLSIADSYATHFVHLVE
ncbi:MAG: AAA family ATPase [Roseiflexaceae bacterium]